MKWLQSLCFLSLAVTASGASPNGRGLGDDSEHIPATPAEVQGGARFLLDPGEVLSVAVAKPRMGREEEQRRYLDRAVALTQELGGTPLVDFRVTSSLGKFRPASIRLMSWPDQAASRAHAEGGASDEMSALRTDGWEALALYSETQSRTLQLSFHPNKFYTVAFAWLSTEHPRDYENYLTGIEGALTSVGGRFLHKLRRPEGSLMLPERGPPDQITFVEWDDVDGLNRLRAQDAYREKVPLLRRGVAHFELYRIEVAAPSSGLEDTTLPPSCRARAC